MNTRSESYARFGITGALAFVAASMIVSIILNGCSHSPAEDTGAPQPQPNTGVNGSSTMEHSLAVAAVAFGQDWPASPSLVHTGAIFQRNGKWYRSGPAKMVIRAGSSENGPSTTAPRVGHVLYDLQCMMSNSFPTRAQAEKAPLVVPSSGLIPVNFVFRNGHWVYQSGI